VPCVDVKPPYALASNATHVLLDARHRSAHVRISASRSTTLTENPVFGAKETAAYLGPRSTCTAAMRNR
jgi:hypothetical protein